MPLAQLFVLAYCISLRRTSFLSRLVQAFCLLQFMSATIASTSCLVMAFRSVFIVRRSTGM